jgi:quinol monooxygenase YgiN
MYGTIARMKVKAGHEGALAALTDQWTVEGVHDGLIANFAYQLDNDPGTIMLAVMFRDEASYKANAASPEQHQRFLDLMQHLEKEPEWMDGQIIFAKQLHPIPG